jgi:outer membrane protein TolC
LLNVKRLQVEEKQAKVNEDRIKFLPVVALGGSYQYNTNLPSLANYQASLGQLPYGGVIIPLPASDEIIQMGNHNILQCRV